VTITWHHIEALSGAGLQEQWQARVEGRSVAVIKQAACDYPRCECEFQSAPWCRHAWTGLIIGPDGLVMDVEITGTSVIALAQTEVERGLERMGWRTQ
jgi:hypothetical protein